MRCGGEEGRRSAQALACRKMKAPHASFLAGCPRKTDLLCEARGSRGKSRGPGRSTEVTHPRRCSADPRSRGYVAPRYVRLRPGRAKLKEGDPPSSRLRPGSASEFRRSVWVSAVGGLGENC